jgi:hypothetical protein
MDYGRVETEFEPMSGPSVVEQARVKIDDARAALSDADRKVRGFVQEHPVATLVGALALGYVVGRVLRKL